MHLPFNWKAHGNLQSSRRRVWRYNDPTAPATKAVALVHSTQNMANTSAPGVSPILIECVSYRSRSCEIEVVRAGIQVDMFRSSLAC